MFYICNYKLIQSQVEWFCVFLDVAPYSDCSPECSSKHILRYWLDKIRRNGGYKTTRARKLFPCQTRASKASEFYKEKSSVLYLIIPSDRIKRRNDTPRSACVSDVQRTSRNAYQRSGLLVTPLERCMLQHDTYDRHN